LPPLSQLSGDFSIPSFYLTEPTVAINLWIGASDPTTGTKSGLHHDYEDNLYILLRGKKKVRLFSPEDSFNIYPVGAIVDISPYGSHMYCGEKNGHWSKISLDDSEEKIRENFPRFFSAKSMECVVNSGEMLYIPNGWWHEVTSFGIHVALNIWTSSA